MKLSELRGKITKKKRKRVGRGHGSGGGKTSGRGHKGQKSRTGTKTRIGFEGGQMPLVRRIPKRGFKNIKHKEYQIVNLDTLNRFKKDEIVSPKALKEKNLIDTDKKPIKILGKGELKKPLKVQAQAFSKSAREAVEKSGGSVTVIK